MQSFNTLSIKTERLILRPLVEADGEALYAIYADPEVMRYWNTPPWTNHAQATDLIAKDIEALRRGQYIRLGIKLKGEKGIVGACSLFDFSEQCRRAEIGYILARAYWGRGIMLEALVELIDHAFDTLGLNRLEADIDPGNQASAKALKRFGFRKEGYLRERWIVAGQASDSELYGLLYRDWVESRSPVR